MSGSEQMFKSERSGFGATLRTTTSWIFKCRRFGPVVGLPGQKPAPAASLPTTSPARAALARGLDGPGNRPPRPEVPGQTGRWLYLTAPQPAARPASRPEVLE
jgi:hypothetical protein